MSLLINIDKPNEFERLLLEAAGDIWIELLSQVPIEVVRKNQEATYLARRLRPENHVYHRKIREWWKITGVWDKLPEIRARRLESDGDTDADTDSA